MGWYVRRGGETKGPVDEETIIEWIRGGMFDADVRYTDWEEWRPLRGTLFVHYFPPSAAPRRSGLGCGWWLLILSLGGCTVGACYAAPHIGWTGWALIFGAWWLGNHLERQQRLLEEIRYRQEHPHDD